MVDIVLEMLSLEVCKDRKIGNAQLRGISGGQKKRMSIGRVRFVMQNTDSLKVLVSCPGVVFLDEPTTGLSSTDSMTVMENMKTMANELGITVVLSSLCKFESLSQISVIHQPRNEVFNAFNRLILMVEGKLAFQGAADAQNLIEHRKYSGCSIPLRNPGL